MRWHQMDGVEVGRAQQDRGSYRAHGNKSCTAEDQVKLHPQKMLSKLHSFVSSA